MNTPLKNIITPKDLASIVFACTQYIEHLASGGHFDQDGNYQHDIFEKALEAVYGTDVWDYVNNVERED